MTLYSHNGAAPAPLPFRIRVPDGNGTRSRTDPSTFTAGEIEAAGYVAADAAPAPVGGIPARWYDGAWRSAPEYDPATEHAPVWTGTAWADPIAKSLAELKAEVKAAARARYAVIVDSGATATIAEGVTIPVSTSTAPALRLMRGKEHMTVAELASMPVVTSAGIPVTLTPTIAAVMLAAIDTHVAACEATQNALVTAINTASTHAALALIDPVAGTIDGDGGWPVNGA